jgi:murein DD-endopeptidase MepM/ murein hydrolase activator NlpD
VVSFAGQVGGELFVTVVHEDGLRTSYAYLSRIDVQVGQNLVAGQSIGSTSGRFHFGVRDGDTYLDPETMLDRARSSAHLVPVH